jgi:RimJ/RimL family protein N-acetyltransferase
LSGLPVDLRPFAPDQLPLVEPWFEDPETQRWLGGPDWPRMALRLADHPLGQFRGARETGRYRFLAWDVGDGPVGYVDCGTFDRWATWEGGADGRGLVSVIDEPSGGIAYVTDPARRRSGYGVAMILALLSVSELAHVQLFAAGIEPENTASVRCLRAAGFDPLDPVSDWEGIVYYARRRT